MGAAKQILPTLPEWAKEIPYQVKKIAVEDAYKEFSNGCRTAKNTFEHGRWFMIVPYRVPTQKADNQGRVVALDLGVRTFLTGYADHV